MPVIHETMTLHAPNMVKPGSIRPHGTENVPDGWLECDGSAISRAAYPALFAEYQQRHGEGDGVTTFRIPDLRGRFPRGWDHGAGRDADAMTRTAPAVGGADQDQVGSLQDDAFASHTHPLYGAHMQHWNQCCNSGETFQPYANSATNAAGGNETRPKNVNVMWIVKY